MHGLDCQPRYRLHRIKAALFVKKRDFRHTGIPTHPSPDRDFSAALVDYVVASSGLCTGSYDKAFGKAALSGHSHPAMRHPRVIKPCQKSSGLGFYARLYQVFRAFLPALPEVLVQKLPSVIDTVPDIIRALFISSDSLF